jgi:hypothetical protein
MLHHSRLTDKMPVPQTGKMPVPQTGKMPVPQTVNLLGGGHPARP